jgi:hypothetical protein
MIDYALHWLLVRIKLPRILWPLLEMHIIGIEKRPQVKPTCSIFEQCEPEPQLNLR